MPANGCANKRRRAFPPRCCARDLGSVCHDVQHSRFGRAQLHAGADCVNPAVYNAVRGTGDKAWFGWPTSEAVEKEVTAWFDAKNLDEEKAAVKRLNKAALEDVVYAPTGFFLSYTAWRKNVSGIAKGPLPFFWGVSKTA